MERKEIDMVSAFQRPFRDMKKTGLGLLLFIIPLANIFSFGYILENAKLSMEGKKTLAPWKHTGALFVQGLFAILLEIIYSLPLLFVGVYTLSLSGIPLGQLESVSFEAALLSSPQWILGLAIVFGLFFAYFAPLAVLAYVHRSSLGEGFRFKRLWKKGISKAYVLPWLVSIIFLNVLVFVVGLQFFDLGVVSYVLSRIALYLGEIVRYTLLGEVYPRL